MLRMWCYVEWIVADVSSQTASGPCNHNRAIKYLPLGVTVVQGWTLSRMQRILSILQLFWCMCNTVWRSHNNTQGCFLQTAGMRKGKFLNKLTGIKKTGGQSHSQDTTVAANTGFWSPVPGRNANWNLISHPSANYRGRAPTHELSKNWGGKVWPLLGLII